MQGVDAFWSWSGKYVGYRVADFLFGNQGLQIGYFAEGDEVYGSNGDYLGEAKGNNRLITNLFKKAWKRRSFTPQQSSNRTPGSPDLGSKDLPPGFEDFSVQAKGI